MADDAHKSTGTPTAIAKVMRCYADNPAVSGFVPVSPATLLRWADAMDGLPAMPAREDRRMVVAALLAHAERMLEEADSFRREQGSELRECAAAFRRVAAWMEGSDAR